VQISINIDVKSQNNQDFDIVIYNYDTLHY